MVYAGLISADSVGALTRRAWLQCFVLLCYVEMNVLLEGVVDAVCCLPSFM
jgi:hypothetical protein